jgi:large subunit ribosomal protein L32
MAVPKKRTSRMRRDMRRSHHALDADSIRSRVASCPQCGAIKQQHNICMTCGTYKSMQVLSVATGE